MAKLKRYFGLRPAVSYKVEKSLVETNDLDTAYQLEPMSKDLTQKPFTEKDFNAMMINNAFPPPMIE